MGKIKILVIGNDFHGVGYYRINSPYLPINDSNIDITYSPISDFTFNFSEDNIKDFNFIVYHKILPLKTNEDSNDFLRIKKKYDIKLLIDIDDYWVLDEKHPNYKLFTPERIQIIINNIKLADFVSTTTHYLADKISEYNKNVVIFENAVNIKEQQWIPNKIQSNKVRFLWGGGISHLQDLTLLSDSIKFKNNDPLLKKIQLFLCGYDLRLMDNNKNFVLGNPNLNPWTNFEKIFTNNYLSIKNKEYLMWLKEYTDNGENMYGYNEKFKDELYQRRWTKPIFSYGSMYNEADVALSPLNNTFFNNMKSQLKVIEAGAHKCPIIASNHPPYTIDIVDGKHGFLIDNNNKNDWYEKIKFFTENPNAIIDMGESLYELVMEKYTLDKINKKRIDFFKTMVDL